MFRRTSPIGNALDADIAEFEVAGVDVVVTKPMRVECLDKIVQYCDVLEAARGEDKQRGTNITLKEYLKSSDHAAD